jgi:hypothetical protein
VISRHDYSAEFLPMAQWLSKHSLPGDLIVASPEVAFVIGFDRKIQDDDHLGYETRKTPEFFVIGPRFRDVMQAQTKDRAIYWAKMSQNYQEVFSNRLYQILQRKPLTSAVHEFPRVSYCATIPG